MKRTLKNFGIRATLVGVLLWSGCNKNQEQIEIDANMKNISINQHYAIGHITLNDIDNDGSFDLYRVEATTLENRFVSRTCVKKGYLEQYREFSDLQNVSHVEVVDSEFFRSYQ